MIVLILITVICFFYGACIMNKCNFVNNSYVRVLCVCVCWWFLLIAFQLRKIREC